MKTGKYLNMTDNEFVNSLDEDIVDRLRILFSNTLLNKYMLVSQHDAILKDHVHRSQHEALRTQYVKMMSTNKSLVVKLRQQIARGNVYREAAIVSETAKCSARRAEMQRAKAAAMNAGRATRVGA